MKKSIFIFAVCIIITLPLIAQQDSTLRKNTIKLDLTSYWLFRNAVNISYERVLKPNRSLSITVGYQEFPRSSDFGSSIAVKEDNKSNGFKLGAEYRFYLAKENKHAAPRGIYIGPYVAYNRFSNERLIEVDDDGTLEEAILTTKFAVLNVGFQIGYQFIINNRWAIDLIFIGPSVSNYKFKATLDGDHDFDSGDIQNEVVLALIDRFPLLKEVIDEKEANSSGRLDVWGYGYRYQLHVGYHFGRKK